MEGTVNYRRMGINRHGPRLASCEVCERDLTGDELAGTSWCGVDTCRDCIQSHATDDCESCRQEHDAWLAWARRVMSSPEWPR